MREANYMKKLALALVLTTAFAMLFSGISQAQSGTEQKLTQMEKELWEGWKMHNADAFKTYMTADAVDVNAEGVTNKDEVVKEIASTDCTVNAYAMENPKFLWVDKNTVVMQYHATQDATCAGHKIPDAVWASSVWANKGGSWKTVFHQESPATPSMTPPEKKD
jgi:hypothetical protein